uniref:Uncharacterized protein n=1 Tax=Solanum tuberosum TaxID=4113 RepID=M1DJX6_SOLTU
MRQPYKVALLLLDDMKQINRAWNTIEDKVSSLHLSISKELVEIKHEHDEDMAKRLDLLSKHVMRSGIKLVNMLLPSASLHLGSLGGIILLSGTARLHADCSISPPISSFPSGFSTLEQTARIRPFGDSPNGFGDSQIFISSFFQQPLFPFAK